MKLGETINWASSKIREAAGSLNTGDPREAKSLLTDLKTQLDEPIESDDDTAEETAANPCPTCGK